MFKVMLLVLEHKLYSPLKKQINQKGIFLFDHRSFLQEIETNKNKNYCHSHTKGKKIKHKITQKQHTGIHKFDIQKKTTTARRNFDWKKIQKLKEMRKNLR